ncbi:MAG TPA: metal ABC transporter permease [bacterium]|nr:metal ABC transporter permease [bacterium]
MFIGGFDVGLLVLPMIAGILVTVTHVPLGQVVLGRGIIFMDIAIAQMAGLGVIVADALGYPAHGWAVQVAAGGAALLGSLGLNWAERRWADVQEALIGVSFVLASAGGILVLSTNPHGAENLKDLLVGQVIWVLPREVLGHGILYALLLTAWFGFRQRLGRPGFYVIFALAVTASVQLVGVFLVFTTLIVPALATRRLAGARRLWVSYGLGCLAYATGLGISAAVDLSTGAVIVWAFAVEGLLLGLAIALITRRGTAPAHP